MIVGNPIAGKGAAASRITELSRCLKSQGASVATYMTHGPGDVAELAGSVDRSVDCLVIAAARR